MRRNAPALRTYIEKVNLKHKTITKSRFKNPRPWIRHLKICKQLRILKRSFEIIGHFQVPFCLHVKLSRSTKPTIWIKSGQQVHFHLNGFALGLILKQRPKGTQKWPIDNNHMPVASHGQLWRFRCLLKPGVIVSCCWQNTSLSQCCPLHNQGV